MQNSLCDTGLDSFFSELIVDPNNTAISDLNAGLDKLFKVFNENANNISEVQNYLVSEFEEGYPELVAANSALNNVKYWWWILLLNRLDNPFLDIKQNFVYSINSEDTINKLIHATNISVESKTSNRIGSTIELN